jgi:cob(I)alamin adenosyltransferase
MYGRRVPKTSRQVAAYGAVDELNAALGLGRALAGDALVNEAALEIQKQLVTLMGELAVAPEDRGRYVSDGYGLVTSAMVDGLTARVDDLEKNHSLTFKGWATPGATPGAAAFDVARTVCRRAEREVVVLGEADLPVNPEIIRYLNRLSDLCWLYARYLETKVEPDAR